MKHRQVNRTDLMTRLRGAELKYGQYGHWKEPQTSQMSKTYKGVALKMNISKCSATICNLLKSTI